MSLPAKIMNVVVREAMQRALLHRKRTAIAEAERQRRSFLRSRAQFRHTMEAKPKVLLVTDVANVPPIQSLIS